MTSSQPHRAAPAKRRARAVERQSLPDREARNPYFRWLIHLGLPMGISLLLHVALFVGLTLKTWQVFSGGPVAISEFEAGLTQRPADQLAGAFKWPGETILQTPNPEAFDFATDVLPRDLSDLADLDTSQIGADSESLETGGFGIGTSGRSGILGTGSGAGSGGGGGFGGGFGSGSGIGKAGVWDLRVQANKIAYVVDFSGSIIVVVDQLKHELKRSVGALKDFQSFNVFIFYSDGDRTVTESFAPTLQPAQPAVRRKFFRWIDAKPPRGHTHPLPAIKRALALRPDAVFLFSDGRFDDRDDVVLAEIARANRDVKAQIHCLVFDDILLEDVSGLPRMTKGAQLLKRIADASGGKAKVVTGADLRGR